MRTSSAIRCHPGRQPQCANVATEALRSLQLATDVLATEAELAATLLGDASSFLTVTVASADAVNAQRTRSEAVLNARQQISAAASLTDDNDRQQLMSVLQGNRQAAATAMQLQLQTLASLVHDAHLDQLMQHHRRLSALLTQLAEVPPALLASSEADAWQQVDRKRLEAAANSRLQRQAPRHVR